MGVIYKVTNKINGRSYIGQTRRTLEQRRKQHERQIAYNSAFHSAIEKYGKDNFQWEIIQYCPNEDLDARESYWIDYYKTFENGYNLTSGGDNADALDQWRKNNPLQVHENAINGLKAANIWHQEHPKESLQQLRAAQEKGAKAVQKRVRCVELDIIFDSIADAERWSLSEENPNCSKASHQHISHVCRGYYGRKTAGGYHWEYVSDETIETNCKQEA